MKEETKKTKPRTYKKRTYKKTVKKTVEKKPVEKKTVEKKPELNETVNAAVVKTTPTDNNVECVHCHKTFEKGYTICPHCHKRQTKNIGLAFLIIFALLFILGIIIFHFVDKYVDNRVSPEYKEECVLVDYENLVRHPKEYKGKDVKLIGEVVSVEGYDTGFGNDMIITINANLFENSSEYLVTISYIDKKYAQGFIEGDMITVYGKYDAINGNIPNIDAKEIEFGKN